MDHDEYTYLVNKGNWPDNSAVPLDEPFVNENGLIQNLILKPVTSVAYIESVAGSIRANHYHKTDWHYAYVVYGRIVYYERPVGSPKIPVPKVFGPNQMFFTPPMVEHTMYFPEETAFVTMAKNVRSHESHESDVVRVKFITKQHIHDLSGIAGKKPKISLTERLRRLIT